MQQVSRCLDLLFIRIECLYCHILFPHRTLYWTQFSAVVASMPTAWFFTRWLVIRASTITTSPPRLTCSKRAFLQAAQLRHPLRRANFRSQLSTQTPRPTDTQSVDRTLTRLRQACCPGLQRKIDQDNPFK